MNKFEGMLLACDMDGTLLDSSRRISERNERALRYFTEEGGRFSLATGRAPGAIRSYLPQLPFNAPYSLLNGSLILNEQHQVMRCAGRPVETKELIQTTLLEFSQIGCEIFIGDRILVCQSSEVTEQHMRTLHLDFETVSSNRLPDTTNWCKINFTGDPALMNQVKAFLKPYQDRFCMASSMPSFWEVTAQGVNKGTALETIAQNCGIPHDRIFAVGDSYNDEDMIHAAYLGFAPANADDGILQAADVHVRENDLDAVAAVVEYLEAHYS